MPLRSFLILLILLILLLPGNGLSADRAVTRKPETAEGRTALIIGNGAYSDAPLANPIHDAEDMAAALRKAGFKVDLRLNSSRRQMEQAIQKLGNSLYHGGVGLFYFAGHGIQVNGINYLIPVDANISNEADVRYEAVDAGRILSQMQLAGNRLNMVFLDACRNNPYKRSFRSARNGLAAMDAPRGSLVSFATAPGRVAADGTGRNGIYTRHLLQQMAAQDLEIGLLMRKVRRGVQKDTHNKQTPFELSSLTGEFYFHKTTVAQADTAASTTSGSPVASPVDNGAEEMWQLVRNSDEIADLRLFLAEYPDSSHRGVAKLRIARLEREQERPAPKIEPVLQPQPLPEIKKGRLSVNAVPADARIRILNIKPRYKRGIPLPAGAYHVEVTRSGYTGNRQWVELAAGEDLRVTVSLDKLPPAPETSVVKRKGRFIAYSNGTVRDSKTGLMWAAKNSPRDVTWQQAKRYCENYTGGGYSDWRMPTRDELSALYSAGIREKNAKGNHLTDIFYWVWASETRRSKAACVGFFSGYRGWSSQSDSHNTRALPVRDDK